MKLFRLILSCPFFDSDVELPFLDIEIESATQ